MRSQSNPPPAPDSGHEDFRYWLALNRTPGIGARRYVQLLNCFDSPAAIFNATRDQLRGAGLRSESIDFVRNPDWKSVSHDF